MMSLKAGTMNGAEVFATVEISMSEMIDLDRG